MHVEIPLLGPARRAAGAEQEDERGRTDARRWAGQSRGKSLHDAPPLLLRRYPHAPTRDRRWSGRPGPLVPFARSFVRVWKKMPGLSKAPRPAIAIARAV